MAMNPPCDRLACGRAINTLHDHVVAGAPDEHQRSCPHCRQTAAALAFLHRAAELMRAEPIRPPPGFLNAVMSRVRAEPHSSRTLPLPADPPLHLSISEHAASALLAIVAETVPGVKVRRCGFPVPTDHGKVQVHLSLRYATLAAADRVRRAIRAAARDQLGVELHTVDIEVDDVH